MPQFFWMLACLIACISPLSRPNSAALSPLPRIMKAAGQNSTRLTAVAALSLAALRSWVAVACATRLDSRCASWPIYWQLSRWKVCGEI